MKNKLTLKQIYHLFYLLEVLFTITLLLGFVWSGWIFFLSLITAVAAMLLYALEWRCPKCGKHLGRMAALKYCPHCGNSLDMLI